MDTDSAVVKARQEVGAEWRGTKGRKGETSVMSTVIKRYNYRSANRKKNRSCLPGVFPIHFLVIYLEAANLFPLLEWYINPRF